MMFGFTNDDADLEAARKWVADAIADGWTIEPTYSNEPVERAASLWKDGYHVLALMRDNSEHKYKYKHEAQINLWGPDGLAITAPRVYDFTIIQAGNHRCGECGAQGVDTQRVGFAGRCCSACLPAARAKYEYPGWTN